MIKLVRSRYSNNYVVQHGTQKMDQNVPITIGEDETALSAVKRLLRFLEIPFEEEVNPEDQYTESFVSR